MIRPNRWYRISDCLWHYKIDDKLKGAVVSWPPGYRYYIYDNTSDSQYAKTLVIAKKNVEREVKVYNAR